MELSAQSLSTQVLTVCGSSRLEPLIPRIRTTMTQRTDSLPLTLLVLESSLKKHLDQGTSQSTLLDSLMMVFSM